MKLVNLMVAIGVFAVPSVSMSQSAGSFGYQDADTPSEAVGMIKSTMFAAQGMKRECQSRYPDLSNEFSANLNTWEKTEAEVMRKTNYHWSVMEKKEPKLLEVPVQVETAVKGQFEILEKARMKEAQQAIRQYCHNYFADLASGVWRKRTPKAYFYMDRAPGK